MGNRYKRMVTLGMISFTALLAWGYCMLAYRSQAVYVAIISLVLVGSIYALLLSFVDIKVAKEQAMQEYVTKTLQEYTKKEDTEILNDMERLAKASYVQQRKTNTYLSAQAEQLDEALKKTIKILINYDRKKEEEAAQQAEQMQKELEMQAALQAQKEPDHTALVLEEFGKLAGDVQAVVAQLQQVTAQLTALREAVDAIEMPKGTTHSSPFIGSLQCIGATSDVKDVAANILSYQYSDAGMEPIIKNTLYIPGFKHLLEREDLMAFPPSADAFRKCGEYIGSQSQLDVCKTGKSSEYYSIISARLGEAFEGQTTLDEALAAIDEQANTTVFTD